MHLNSKHREYTVIILALATIIPGSWLMGGYFSKAPYWMGLGGWIAGLFSVYQLVKYKKLRRQNPALKWIWILWAFFFVFLGISLLNPSYRLIEAPRGIMFVVGKPLDWLPSVVAVRESAPMILQLSGSLVLAWSLLAVVRSEGRIHVLLIGLVVNALILSLVGAWFKITGAENILNIFAAVNPKFYASFTYHNHWVAFAGFHLMLATGLVCFYSFHPGRDHRHDRSSNLIFFLWVAVFFIFLSLFLCESRTGILFASGYVGIMGLYFLRRRLVARRKTTSWIAWLSVLALIASGAIGYQIVLPQLSETSGRIEEAWYSISDSENEVDNFRFNVGPKITARLIDEKSMLGWGWGSYPMAMSIYASEYLDNRFAQHAHNDWLQFVAELGAVGCFLFIFPLIHMSIHFKPRNNLTRFSRLGIGLLMGIALFEAPFTNPVVLASVLIVVSADLSRDSKPKTN